MPDSNPSTKRVALPIDALLPQIEQSLRATPNLVIEAAPGAGKTTRVPPALLNIVHGEVIVLEPRRIASRMAARRVAEEMGEKLGETVGYQVRFEDVSGPRTRLRFVTEGVLTRRMISDPDLKGVDAVILDEFHERHLDGDLALALLKRLQQRRQQLRIVVMSATLDAAPVAAYLDNCPTLRSEGRAFPLTVQHMPYSAAPLEDQVRNAVDSLVRNGETGNILVFLPGSAEIRRAARACESVAARAGLLVLPLHGGLTPQEQDRAVAPSREQKLILATNVAESSLTVDGVTAVIDSGLARIATHSPWTGMPSLHIGRISKASARQRAGRAGRTAPGRVIRLYAEEDFAQRADHDVPEILRSDLSQLCLTMRSMGLTHATNLDWLDTPAAEALRHAEELLDALGASGSMAKEMARYPLPPRHARIVVEAVKRGAGARACSAVALLGSSTRSVHSDILQALDAGLDPNAAQQANQLRRIARTSNSETSTDDALLMSLLCGFPDHVARRRGNQILLANGMSAEIATQQHSADGFCVALDAEDRKDKPLPIVRITARIEPDWLIELFPESITETDELEWNRHAERVERVTRLQYRQLTLQEWRDAPSNAEAAAQLLAEKVLEAGIERFIDADALVTLQERIRIAGMPMPSLSETVQEVCYGMRSFSDVRASAASILTAIESKVDTRRLNELAPVSIRLQAGRHTKVHYEPGKAPWIASRLQDFFGMRDTPRIGPGHTPVVVHLLAPNQRAVQTTTDLAGFWVRLYPTVRKELMRRYPRHAWPEIV